MQKSKFSTIPIAARVSLNQFFFIYFIDKLFKNLMSLIFCLFQLPTQTEIKTMKPVPQIIENIRLASPTLVPLSNTQNPPLFTNRTISLSGITEIKSPATMAEMERQILELRKITDELRKQFELSQKQNEEYRLRLEKLEQDREFEEEEIL